MKKSKRLEVIEAIKEAVEDSYDYAIDTGWSFNAERVLEILEDYGVIDTEAL